MIRFVLFDWGNVLVQYRPLGFVRLAEAVDAPTENVVTAVQAEGLFEDLLVGRASPVALSARLANRFGRTLDRTQLAACFAQDVAEPMPGMRELVCALTDKVRLGLLSNTFFGHWDHLERDPFYERFELRMASHEIGAAKPNPVVFRSACERAGLPPEQVLFIDDSQEHVDAAQAEGLRAHVFEGADQTAVLLRQAGIP